MIRMYLLTVGKTIMFSPMPSGKHTSNNGKPPFLIGKINELNGPLSVAMWNYQRVISPYSIFFWEIRMCLLINVGETCHKPSPAMTIFKGGIPTIPSHGWFMDVHGTALHTLLSYIELLAVSYGSYVLGWLSFEFNVDKVVAIRLSSFLEEPSIWGEWRYFHGIWKEEKTELVRENGGFHKPELGIQV